MTATTVRRTARALAAAALVLTAVASGTAAADAARPTERRGNATGTAAGSAPNGAGNLKMSLATLSDGRIKVTWKRPTKASQIRKWTVTVGPSRSLNINTKSYTVNRKAQSKVVAPAYGAAPSSGNYSFVQVTIFRTRGTKASSPTKWIQAPIPAACTASAANQVRVATFNVRGWDKDAGYPQYDWNTRGPNVVAQILGSGARVVGIQEANVQNGQGYTSPDGARQHQWILDHLNASDTDPSHQWVDALGDDYYKRGGGLVGTRIFIDAAKYTVLDRGIERLSGRDGKGDSLLPWARLQAVGATQPAFTFADTHLRVGENADGYVARQAQVKTMSDFLHGLQARNPGEQLIVVGDMNSSINSLPDNYVQDYLVKNGFYDSFATPSLTNPQYGTTFSFTFPLRVSPYRRDYIMSLGPVPGSCAYANQVVTSAAGVASDHFLQAATLPLATF
jgi:endonuclease/exonuclease/phosphatase family metal-dependent hydrolase